MVSLSFVFEFP
jgi:hypothetical protein